MTFMTFISDVQIREAVRVVLREFLESIANDCIKSLREEMNEKASAEAVESMRAVIRKTVEGVTLEYSKQLKTALQLQGQLQRKPVANVVGNWWDPLCKKNPLSVRSRRYLETNNVSLTQVMEGELADLPSMTMPVLKELLAWRKSLTK